MTVLPRPAADLRKAGVSRRALTDGRWRRVAYGWYVPAGDPSPAQRIVEALALAPAGAVLAGWAAAYVLGTEMLDGRDPVGDLVPVDLLLLTDLHRPNPPGVRYTRTHLEQSDRSVVCGIPVTGGLRTALDLARGAPDVVEAVVALDAMRKAHLVKTEALVAATARLTKSRGTRQARIAVRLSRSSVRSPWETRLRLFYVLELGLPTPLVNPPVFDLQGRFLGAPDLLDVEAGLAMEFDGAQHRGRTQHREDNVREELFERAGLVVVRADSLDLRHHRAQLRKRVLDARAEGLGLNRPRRWTLDEPASWLGLPA